MVGMVLDARVAMYIAWASELRMFYDDAYIPVLGKKHPQALGCPFWQVWPELEQEFLPVNDAALAGNPTYFENTEMLLRRDEHDAIAWFTFSIAPIRSEDGTVPDVWVTVLETTEQVLAERKRTAELDLKFSANPEPTRGVLRRLRLSANSGE